MGVSQDLLYTPDVIRITRRSRSWLIEQLKNDNFPKPVRVGKRNAWPRPALMVFLGLATIANPVSAAAPDTRITTASLS